MKGPYKDRTTIISEKEKLNRRKFAASQAWLKPVIEFLRVGFKGYSERSEGFVSAKSYLHKNALRVEEDNVIIDPDVVRVSAGDLPMSEGVAVNRSGPNELTFTWSIGSVNGSFDKDQVMMLAYNVQDGQVCYNLTGQFRFVGRDILPLELDLITGSVFHVYIAFVAADRSRQSNSLYLGEIMI